ncbi:NrfD/PsrC family molybdoenzyme membrane anchor subunit [Bdellovibrio sp. HCB185ZH]|uniref:NrfD/PsrC family molybdoenzyme membrane anchor subunit n=1 Tax=Bdellovibrio TaxID=958 RepID=UPI001157EB89|nr:MULTISPECIES: NrfD/PsrC family molybdoenzyme membrane anchor subunit [unclassified Bdellovibrio]QDK45201.1 hydrogenase [Bdellovibrio sp. ZAP7]QLY26908.1 polysulfide reductase NrfD [Bdellovibrio sp. KM01]
MIKRSPLVLGNKTLKDVSDDICAPVERFPSKGWIGMFLGAKTLLLFYIVILACVVGIGIGLLGVTHPVFWGTMIVTFVFWIGIGHAGTLISAVLFLFRQKWRTSVARTAEAMTVFAVMTAGLFPLLHTGRPWLDYWLFPYPNQRGPLWVNFRSPLLWDVFAVSTYATVSMVFWYIGLVPDFATIKDRAKNKLRRAVYGALSLGWRGTAKNWSHYEMLYLLLAGLSTPLVLSVHTIVSFDFAVSNLPGWHTTIFPPYFVAGAIFSGFAMVVTLMTLVRIGFPEFKNYVTLDHMEVMNKIIMTTGMLVGYAYASEFFIAWYSGNPYERFAFVNRAFGPYAWSYWIMVSCNVLSPQVFWFKKLRRSIPVMFVVSIFVNIGMWFERFVITVTSLHRDFLPANWGMYQWSWFDTGVLVGSFGMFLTLFLLYLRLFPAVSIAEVKPVLHVGYDTEGGHH